MLHNTQGPGRNADSQHVAKKIEGDWWYTPCKAVSSSFPLLYNTARMSRGTGH